MLPLPIVFRSIGIYFIFYSYDKSYFPNNPNTPIQTEEKVTIKNFSYKLL
ncbi:hypothetical protein HMPREF9075_02509 [Capnocytophaga sp. oral taxon 332 str. F0381]|nr:hypothetical protein HMPREF9075_02509 [Capnocytophaga sp. oral taxon 332 str. F0381]